MLKIIYAGTPEFSVPALLALSQSGHQIIAVYTQPDRRAGRGRKLQSSPVKQTAVDLGIPVIQPSAFKAQDIAQFTALQADLMVVAAYGLLLPPAILAAPTLGCINIHASLLPRWRGAAPIQRAILAGDTATGITIMQMNEGLDAGACLAKRVLTIQPNWNAGDLHDALMQTGADLLIPTIHRLMHSDLQSEPQSASQVTYATKLVKSEAAIDWSKDAERLHREVRAYAPWPVSFTQLGDQSLRIWRTNCLTGNSIAPSGRVIAHDKRGIQVSCGHGILQILELQFAGKTRWSAAQALNANNLTGQDLV